MIPHPPVVVPELAVGHPHVDLQHVEEPDVLLGPGRQLGGDGEGEVQVGVNGAHTVDRRPHPRCHLRRGACRVPSARLSRGDASDRRIVVQERGPDVERELVAEIDEQHGLEQTGLVEVAEGLHPDPGQVLGTADPHPGVLDVLPEPAGEDHGHPVAPRGGQEGDQGRQHAHPDRSRCAPHLLVPHGHQLPLAVRTRGHQMGVGIDPDGVVPAVGEFIQRLLPVLVARAGPSALQPREVPHGQGHRSRRAVRHAWGTHLVRVSGARKQPIVLGA